MIYVFFILIDRIDQIIQREKERQFFIVSQQAPICAGKKKEKVEK